jgi:hypothetical protein
MSAVGTALRGIGYLISLFGALIMLFGILLVLSPEEVGLDPQSLLSRGDGGPMPEWLRALGPHAFWVVGLAIFAIGIGFSWFNPLRGERGGVPGQPGTD